MTPRRPALHKARPAQAGGLGFFEPTDHLAQMASVGGQDQVSELVPPRMDAINAGPVRQSTCPSGLESDPR